MRRSVKTHFTMEPAFCVMGALAVLLFPFQWVIAWFAATAVHELGHYLLLRTFNINIFKVQIGSYGVLMHTGPQTLLQSAICSLAGPIAGFMLLILSEFNPILSICGFIQSVFNLLPIYPLDGGAALYALIGIISDEHKAEKYIQVIGNATILIITIGLILFSFQIRGLKYFLIIFIIFITKTLILKFPCKQREVIVQ